MTLYEIDAQIRAFIDQIMENIDEETGEVPDIDPSKLEELNEAREKKLENIALYIKNLEAEAEAIKAEEKTLKARRDRDEKKAERLKKLLAESLHNADQDKFTTARCAVSFRRSKAVVVTNQDILEERFIKKKITYEVDKALLKKALEEGTEDIDGAHLEERQNIQIK